ncbi:MAG: glycosyltransferase family 4 protein [Gemmatimonadales bacterium]|nr:glycosyltransferase family 4 protein [Gemmatimonadales bacterium]MDZ4390634.1 glycosyltransferase family 4 protein [Gemmatimonadales bacterium]
MRVLMVEMCEDGTIGGSHRMLESMVHQIAGTRYHPVIMFYQDNPVAHSLHALGYEVHRWDLQRANELAAIGIFGRLSGWVAAVRRRYAFIKSTKVSLVHLNNLPTRTIELWLPACRMAGVPLVAHARGVLPPTPTPERLDRLRRRLAGHCNKVVCVSEHVQAACTHAGIPLNVSTVVYDGVDESRWTPPSPLDTQAARKDLNLQESDLMVLIVGNIKRWKGQAAALTALQHLPVNFNHRIRVILAGAIPDDPKERDYVEEVRALGALLEAERGIVVSMIGPRSDVKPLYDAADLVVHCSIEPEPLGTVVLEAMSMGKPIVGSALGGPAEMLREGSGVLADPRDAKAFGAAIESVLCNSHFRHDLSTAALARARQFRLRDYTSRICAIYDDVVQ